MPQKKYLIMVGVLIAVVGLASGVLVLRRGQHHANDGLGSSFDNLQSAQTNAGGSTPDSSGSQSTPQLTPAATSSGLSTSSTPSTGSLGQLSGNQNASSGASGSGTASSGSSSPTQPDPSTFSQYDKYQNATAPLFADIQAGTGTALAAGHQASVYYKGWLTNGELFDQSRTDAKGQLQPFAFTLGEHQVITGWEEGLAGMKVGGTRLLVIPPSAGYGATGQGAIPGNAVLVFEVQLLAVQ